MTVTACPDLDRLLRFLDGPSAGGDDEAIAVHLERCAACRAELDRLAAATELPALRSAPTGRHSPGDLAFLRDLKGLDLSHLSEAPPPRASEASPAAGDPRLRDPGGAGSRRRGRRLPRAAPHPEQGRGDQDAPPQPVPDRGRPPPPAPEAEAVARLQHPNVVQLYEIGEAGGSPYLVLEYVDGGTLESHLAGRPQPPREAAALVATLARAVHAAHLKQIIHRDLKPANILLHRELAAVTGDTRPEEDSRSAQPSSFDVPKITDFGLAKRLDRTASGMTQSLSGTPAYMSPEQVPDGPGEPPATPITPATDVYALGVILYEMMTGRPPFLGTDWVTTLLQVVRPRPGPAPRAPARHAARPADHLPEVPGEGAREAVRDRRRAGRRPGPVPGPRADPARPVGPVGRLARWGRRNPVPAGLLGAVVVTGLVGVHGDPLAMEESGACAAGSGRGPATGRAGRRGAERARQDAVEAQRRERWERYRSNIAAAAAALQLQNSSTARRALDEAPEEHLDWEWRHLHSQLDGSRAVMPGGMPAWGYWQLPIISPSGKELAAPDRDGRTINIWDATTGAALGALRGHEGDIYALAYSPDGRRLASGSADKTLRLWDPAAGKELAVLRGHEQRVEWLTYSPDGQRICSLDRESGRLWDATTGRPIAVLGGPVRPSAARFTAG